MNDNIVALKHALDAVRDRLMHTPRTSPGFGEMRQLYNDLTRTLIDAGEKEDAELANALQSTAQGVAEEWESNKSGLSGWSDVLSQVVSAAGVIFNMYGLPNPLAVFAK